MKGPTRSGQRCGDSRSGRGRRRSAAGATRDITATVVWQLAGSGASGPAKLVMTYDMTVIDQGGKWYVHDIAAPTRGNQPAAVLIAITFYTPGIVQALATGITNALGVH